MRDHAELEHHRTGMERDENASTTRNPQVFFRTARLRRTALFSKTPHGASPLRQVASGNRHGYLYHDALTAAMLSPQVDVRFATLCHDLAATDAARTFGLRHGHGPAA